ncbi:MAG: hypothetical protein ABIH03_13590 [Pseudomonadota bacterium]
MDDVWLDKQLTPGRMFAYAVVFIDPDQVSVHLRDCLDRRTLMKVDEHYCDKAR